MNTTPSKETPPEAAALFRVFVVEDHPMIRDGIRALCEATTEFVVCGEASTRDEALEGLRRERPDIVTLDLGFGPFDGVELIGQIKEIHPPVRILVLSVRDEDLFAERCLKAGALGFVMKTEPNEVIIAALERVASGEVFVSVRLSIALLNRVQSPHGLSPNVESLSAREQQVFRLFGLGYSTRRVSEHLGIGVKTVETHRENIKNKLGIDHSSALVRTATLWVRDAM